MLITSTEHIDDCVRNSVIDMANREIKDGIRQYMEYKSQEHNRVKCAEFLAPIFAQLADKVEQRLIVCCSNPKPEGFKLTFNLEEVSKTGTNGWTYTAITYVTITFDRFESSRPIVVEIEQHTGLEKVSRETVEFVHLDP